MRKETRGKGTNTTINATDIKKADTNTNDIETSRTTNKQWATDADIGRLFATLLANGVVIRITHI